MAFLFAINTVVRSVAIACAIVVLAAPAASLAGEQPTQDQILNALRPPAKTRSLTLTRSPDEAKLADDRRFIDGLRKRSARSLTVEEREKVAEIAKEKPSISLEINFGYNSASVGLEAVPVLLALGRALSVAELKESVFLINGHTDGKGGAEYNQDLSQRRAEAVKRILVDQFGLPVTTLVAIGYGKTQLKNAADPFAGENRRVQIVNTELKANVSQ